MGSIELEGRLCIVAKPPIRTPDNRKCSRVRRSRYKRPLPRAQPLTPPAYGGQIQNNEQQPALYPRLSRHLTLRYVSLLARITFISRGRASSSVCLVVNSLPWQNDMREALKKGSLGFRYTNK